MLIKKPGESGEIRWPPGVRTDLLVRQIGEETVVLDRCSNQIHRLNQSASFVWQHCDGRRTVHQICDELIQAFDVDTSLAERDTEKLVEKFNALGLLEDRRENEEIDR